jgi:hypothetical protein
MAKNTAFLSPGSPGVTGLELRPMASRAPDAPDPLMPIVKPAFAYVLTNKPLTGLALVADWHSAACKPASTRRGIETAKIAKANELIKSYIPSAICRAVEACSSTAPSMFLAPSARPVIGGEASFGRTNFQCVQTLTYCNDLPLRFMAEISVALDLAWRGNSRPFPRATRNTQGRRPGRCLCGDRRRHFDDAQDHRRMMLGARTSVPLQGGH